MLNLQEIKSKVHIGHIVAVVNTSLKKVKNHWQQKSRQLVVTLLCENQMSSLNLKLGTFIANFVPFG